MTYRISGPARADLAEIWTYTFEEWGQGQADVYLEALVTRFKWLAANKSVWQKRPELGRNLYSYYHERHVIFFAKGEDSLDILRVLHERMDLDPHDLR